MIYSSILLALILAQTPMIADSASSGITYYVAPNGSDSNSGSFESPWQTLRHSAYLVRAGDTVVLRGGIYPNDSLGLPAGASTPTEPITITAYPGEVPILTGNGSGTTLSINSPAVLDGLTFLRNNVSDVVDIWSSYVTVQNCTFKETGGQFVRINGTSHITIQNNVFDTNGYINTDGENDAIVMLGANYVLIQNNYGTRSGHYFVDAVRQSTFGSNKNIVVRDNTVEQYWGGGIGETGQGALNMLIENNRISHVGEGVAYVKTNFLLNASGNIVRNNVLTNEAGWYGDNGLLLAGQKNGVDSNAEHNRIYNNVFYKIGYLPIFLSQRESNGEHPTVYNYVTDNKVVNNILYDNETQRTVFFPSGDAYITAETYHSPDKPWPFFPYYNYFSNNLMGDDASDNSLFTYNTPTSSTEWNLSSVQKDYPAYISGNIQQNPEFVNADAGNFELAGSSPAIGAGAHLTHTTSSGASATIPVDDAYFFSDGLGLVSGDRLKIGHNSPVTVTGVNYTGKTITVSSSVTFSKGDAVDLANYKGSAPDMGAFEYSSSAPDIFNVAASVHNATSAGVAWSTSSDASGQVKYGATTAYGETSLVDTEFATAHTITLSGLQPNSTYHYAVISIDASGGRSESADFTFTTPGASGPLASGIIVSGISLSGSGGSATAAATISWTTNEPSSTQVLYSAGGWHPAYIRGSPISNVSGSTSHSVRLTGLVPNATYHFAVQSTDLSGRTSYSSDGVFTTPAIAAPGPVIKEVSVTTSSGPTAWFAAPHGQGFAPSGKNCCGYSFAQATISWKTNVSATNNTVLLTPISIGGSIETVELSNSTQAAVSGNPAATTTPALTIYQLAPNTTYEYRVESTDSSGHTTSSPTEQFTTPALN